MYKIPHWFGKLKFGIFTHWIPSVVPSYLTEWYPRYLYHTEASLEEVDPYIMDGGYPSFSEERREKIKALSSKIKKNHRLRWGDPKEFGFKDFLPHFKGEKFDSDEWLRIIKSSGARYFIPVAEHHDGFSMYHSSINKWNAKEMGPKRDIIAELRNSTKNMGLKFGVSSHVAWKWHFYNYNKERGLDLDKGRYQDLYGVPHGYGERPNAIFAKEWQDKTLELMKMSSPDLIYFDFGWHDPGFDDHRDEVVREIHDYFCSKKDGGAIIDKGILEVGQSIRDVERGSMPNIQENIWQCDTSISFDSWCDVANDNYKSPQRIIFDLCDVVSKNGNLLLNITPRINGTISNTVSGILKDIGEWLSVNGEAIYDTAPWDIFGEVSEQNRDVVLGGNYIEPRQIDLSFEDIRFTKKQGVIYAIMMGWPGLKVRINSLGMKKSDIKVARVNMLGNSGTLNFDQKEDCLEVEIQQSRPCDFAYTLKISH